MLFKELFNNFLEVNKETEAIIVSDEEGLIIAGEKREDINMEIVSVLTTIVNPILDRIRFEFDFKKFGSCSFETKNNRLIFLSIDEHRMLSMVLNNMASIEHYSPYGYFLAEKTAQIINLKEGDQVQLSIPNFKSEALQAKRMKNQFYQLKIDTNGFYKFKFIIIGDHNVGKTSIIRRFSENRFLADYRATIGLNIISHDFESFGNNIKVDLWDIGAQEYFRRYRKTYYNGAQAGFIVFDLTNGKSFENIKNWYNELNEFIQNKNFPILIVGNKKDLAEERVIDNEDASKMLQDLIGISHSTITYVETSALTGENIDDAFKLISYNFITKSNELAQQKRNQELRDEIYHILQHQKNLNLTFITEDPHWNPGLQIMIEANNNENLLNFRDKEDEKYYQYSNGLILKNCFYFLKDVTGSDGVFCIFDARNRTSLNNKWIYIINKIITYLEKDKVLVIGLLVSETTDWSVLIQEFRIEEELERKMGSIIFFKIGKEFQLEIYNQLKAMLIAVKNLL